ncbi:MAG: phospholipase D-like domain-containing protein [Propionibacteriaceae bacterium]|jgi:cardiolipin synthase|nr:phospholipase D-like domain-containing protein [Propionibacteriaceae bacterium]
MTWRSNLGRHLLRVIGAVCGIQLGTAIVVNTIASLHRKRRKLKRFPYLPPQELACDDNQLTIFTYGDDLYASMIEAIDAAHDRVYLESFIWKADSVGLAFKEALIRAANRGVKVVCIWDAFANLVVPASFFRFPPNIECHSFPLVHGGLTFWLPRNSGRDHRKILLVDGQIGYVGGYNLGSLYAHQWRDTHLKVAGDFALELEASFVQMWRIVDQDHHRLTEGSPRPWHPAMRLLRNVPRTSVYPIRSNYLDAINRATKRIWLTHAYLLPDADLMAALLSAASRGVDVSIIIPETSNHPLADWLSRAHYDALLTGGVKLFLYQGAMIHSKTASIDSIWSTIGTANLDRVSLLGNYEINVEIIDPSVAAKMEAVFRNDLSNCQALSLDTWRARPYYAQLAESILKPLRPLL